MTKKRVFDLLGMVLGVVMLCVGIGVKMSDSADWSFGLFADSASFGADFYTYVYEAVEIICLNTVSIANNISILGGIVFDATGLLFIFAGLIVLLHYAKAFFCEESVAKHVNMPISVNDMDAMKQLTSEVMIEEADEQELETASDECVLVEEIKEEIQE